MQTALAYLTYAVEKQPLEQGTLNMNERFKRAYSWEISHWSVSLATLIQFKLP
jgi:hypothetical protein